MQVAGENVDVDLSVKASEYTDSELVDGIRCRDEHVFKHLQTRYKHGIRLMVCMNGGNADDAEDLFCDGLVRLMEIVDRHGFKLTCKLPSLLYAICEKKWKLILLKRRTAARYHRRKLDTTPEDDFIDVIDKSLYSMIFWESFNKLNDDCKRIFRSYFKELYSKEIAEILNYSYGYLRKRKCLCHKSLVRMVNVHPEYRKIKATEIL